MPNSNHKVIAVIPAYNESAKVGQVVKDVLGYADEVIVVDDCSKDSTSEAARSAGATVIRHEKNTNYDGALTTGFAEAARHGATIIFSIDADGQHKATDIPRLINPIKEGRADIVIAQRSSITHFAEKIFAFYTRHHFGVKDPLCGMKAYSRAAYDAIGTFDTTKSIGTELMLRAIASGKKAEFIDIVCLEREAGDSSRFYSRKLKANMKIFKAMLRVMKKVGF